MTKCPRQPRKQRRRKPHSKRGGGKKIMSYSGGSEYKRPYKGHQWEGHGVERRCALCGKRPKGQK